jgi:hypothetical protein
MIGHSGFGNMLKAYGNLSPNNLIQVRNHFTKKQSQDQYIFVSWSRSVNFLAGHILRMTEKNFLNTSILTYWFSC